MDVSPTCRTFATLCPLIDPEMVGIKFGPAVPPLEQKLFLLWGKKTDNEIIPDSWVFDAKKKQWNQVSTILLFATSQAHVQDALGQLTPL